jgi:diguanylate cyclase
MSAALQAIRTAGSTRCYESGQSIFLAGDEAESAFIIEKGAVEIWTGSSDERLVLTLLEEGELFGALTILEGVPRIASATAIGETVLTVVTDDPILRRIENTDPVVRLIVNMLLDRLRSTRPASSSDRSSSGLRAIAKMRMESALQHALVFDAFELYYQPIVDLSTSQIVGVEALLRWNHPVLGHVNPQEIINLAEETNLIIAIDRWVLRRAIHDLAGLPEQLFMTINLSGQEIGRLEILDYIDQLVAESGSVKGRIKLEVTEGIVLHAESAVPWITACQARGYPVVLDDFGTGYSSLSYLLRLSVSTLKIDRSFVTALDGGHRATSIITAIIGMASTMGVTVVAEGIETDAQAALLRAMGCQLGQGYQFARPMPLATLLGMFVPSSANDQGMK